MGKTLLGCLLPALLLLGCAGLPDAVIGIDGADVDGSGAMSAITLAKRSPALLRAVDENMIPGIQVPSALRSFTYILRPGPHTLWASSVPAGIPWLPQRLSCYVLHAELLPGARYVLGVDTNEDVAVLSAAESTRAPIIGPVVDRPFVFERTCNWRIRSERGEQPILR